MKASFLLLLTATLVLSSSAAIGQSQRADVPRTLSYQGVIRSASGEAVSGPQSLLVRLYSDPEGKQLVWEDQFSSSLEQGTFNLMLGSNKPLPDASILNQPLWVGIRVGEGSEIRPLSAITASAYALNVPNGSITADKIGADYVSSIYVNGTRVTDRGSSVNIVAGDGLSVNVDPQTKAIVLGSTQVSQMNGKGATPQGQPVTAVTASSPLASSGGTTPNVSLSGVVAVSNGGTGSSTQNFVDLSTSQSIGGSKTFTSSATMSAAMSMSNNQIHNVATPTSSADAATKAYADAVRSDMADSVAAERTRATAAEGTLTSNLSTEVSRAQAAEATLTTNLNTEISDRQAAVTAEAGARSAADATLTTNLANEVTRAQGAEATLTTNLSNEVANRQAAVTAEANARSSADATLTTNLANEVSRAQGAESTLTTNLSAEVTNRQAAVSAEASARSAADATLTTNLANEVTRAQSAEGTLTTNLANEISRAQGAEATLTTNLANEVTRAQGAEGTLTTNLNAEIANRQAAVTAEANARGAADQTLTTNLANEVTRAQGAEGTLTTNLNAEIAARQAADAQSIATSASPTFAGLTLNGNATVRSIIPSANNFFDLGNTTHRWAHTYSNAGDFSGSMTIGGATTVGTTLSAGGQVTLGAGMDAGNTDITNVANFTATTTTIGDETINNSLSTNGPIYNYNSLFELQPMYLYSTLYNYSTTSLGGTLDMNTNSIVNLADPTSAQDAANKNYVDVASMNVTQDFSGFGSGTYSGHTLTVTGSTANVVTLVGYNSSVSGSDDYSIGIKSYGEVSGSGVGIGGDFSAKNTSASGYAIGGRFSATGAAHNIAVQATSGAIQVQTAGEGIILKSPNGTCYKLTVANDGTLTTTLMSSCP